MKKYTIYNGEGKILRSGFCATAAFEKKAGDGEFIIEGIGNDVTQKVTNLGQYGMKPIGFLKIIDKTPEEMVGIEIPKLRSLPFGKQSAHITNEGLADILKDIEDLKSKISVLESEV